MNLFLTYFNFIERVKKPLNIQKEKEPLFYLRLLNVQIL